MPDAARAGDLPFRIGIDIGGTFTDLLLVDDRTGQSTVVKTLTTAEDPSIAADRALREALRRGGADPSRVRNVVHGTTLVTNALIERKGERTALITTRGFRDVLEIRREHRYDMYDLFIEPPKEIVPRHLRFEIDERILADGTVLRAPERSEVERLVDALTARGIQAIAVSLLHSYRNPSHEELVGRVIAERAPDARFSLSSAVVPELKEYERTSTTVCNAYVQRLVERYLAEIARKLADAGIAGRLYVMLSSGGAATPETSRQFPIRLLESGPAAGALAAAHVGAAAGYRNLLSFDMGGTTAKLCVIEDGAPLRTSQFEVDRVYRFKKGSGLPIKTPVIELIEIGAGGGSIARIDALSRLTVGPDSAGAHPGPACYARGGRLPTVTDADLVLGYLDPGFFLGGGMRLDAEAAAAALDRHVARPLGLSIEQAAWAVHHMVNEHMANAARIHAVDRGKNPRDFPMFAFGGAGPVHAAGVASILGSPSIVLPLGAGVGSTLGFLAAPLSFDFVRSAVEHLDRVDWPRVNRLRQAMEDEGVDLLQRSGVARGELTISHSVDLRYVGQGHEVVVPVPGAALDALSVEAIGRAFAERYICLYGRTPGVLPLEAVSWRVAVSGPKPVLRLTLPPGRSDSAASGRKGGRPACFAASGEFRETAVYDRYRFGEGVSIDGPAIIEERESTVVVPPGWSGVVDRDSNLVLSRTR